MFFLSQKILLLVTLCISYFLFFNKDLCNFCYEIIYDNSYFSKNYLDLEKKKKIKEECLNIFKFEKNQDLSNFYRYQEFQKRISKIFYNPNIDFPILFKNILKNNNFDQILIKLKLIDISFIILYIFTLYFLFFIIPYLLYKSIVSIIKILFIFLLLIVIVLILFKLINENFSLTDSKYLIFIIKFLKNIKNEITNILKKEL